MLKSLLLLLVLLALSLSATPLVVHAQDEACPALVQTALGATDSFCTATGRNQACYGNFALQTIPQPNVASFVFRQPGNIGIMGDDD